MINTVVARRYANAVFALSCKEGEKALETHGASLAELGRLIAAVPELDNTLKSPVISVEEKKAVVGALLDKIGADKCIRNFCFLLADKERLAFLRDIAAYYGKKLDEARGVIRGRLTTAVELSAEKQAELKAELQKQCGTEMELTFTVDKDILGGMVLSLGDRVLDASLRAQLRTLRENFKRGE